MVLLGRLRWHESVLGKRSPAPRVNRILRRSPWLAPGAIMLLGLLLGGGGLALARSATGIVGGALGLVAVSVGFVGLIFGVSGLLSALIVGLIEEERNDEDSYNG